MAEKNDIPENADKILFAEDMVNYFMFFLSGVPNSQRTAEPFRELVPNGFNVTTRNAIHYFDEMMDIEHDEFLDFMRNEDEANSATYARFVDKTKRNYGFHSKDNFLVYCVHLAHLATYFYNIGVREAPSLAVFDIIKAFDDFRMVDGKWDTFNRIAQKYKSLDKYFDILLPDDEDIIACVTSLNVSPKQNNIDESDADFDETFSKVTQNDSALNDEINQQNRQKRTFTQNKSNNFKESSNICPKKIVKTCFDISQESATSTPVDFDGKISIGNYSASQDLPGPSNAEQKSILPSH